MSATTVNTIQATETTWDGFCEWMTDLGFELDRLGIQDLTYDYPCDAWFVDGTLAKEAAETISLNEKGEIDLRLKTISEAARETLSEAEEIDLVPQVVTKVRRTKAQQIKKIAGKIEWVDYDPSNKIPSQIKINKSFYPVLSLEVQSSGLTVITLLDGNEEKDLVFSPNHPTYWTFWTTPAKPKKVTALFCYAEELVTEATEAIAEVEAAVAQFSADVATVNAAVEEIKAEAQALQIQTEALEVEEVKAEVKAPAIESQPATPAPTVSAPKAVKAKAEKPNGGKVFRNLTDWQAWAGKPEEWTQVKIEWLYIDLIRQVAVSYGVDIKVNKRIVDLTHSILAAIKAGKTPKAIA